MGNGSFAIAAGINAAALNQVSATVYNALYPRVFTGSATTSKDGVKVTISWDVRSAPTFTLQTPSRGLAVLRAHSRHWPPLTGISKADALAAVTAELENTTFEMQLSQVEITVDGTPPAKDTASVTVFVQLTSDQGKVSFVPIKAIGQTQNPDDEIILNEVILPAAISLSNDILSGLTIPSLNVGGIGLSLPVVTIGNGAAVVLFNLAGDSVPSGPFPGPWPATPFFLLLSDAARLAIARAATANFSKDVGGSGSIDLAISTVSWGLTATLSSIGVAVNAPGQPTLAFTASAVGNLNAGLTVACTRVGVNYNFTTSPPPSGAIALSIVNGSTVRATVTQVNNFVPILIPTGNVLEVILSAITDPILQAVVAAVSPKISTDLSGIAFDVWQVQSVGLNVQGFGLTLTPANLQTGSFSGYMSVTGDVSSTAGGGALAMRPGGGAKGTASADTPIGPLTRVLLEKVWPVLFTPGSPLYVPNVILNGDSALGLPSYDPYPPQPNQFVGPMTAPLGQEFPDACSILPTNPKVEATANSSLTLQQVKVTNLHYVNRLGNLSYPGEPSQRLVQATLQFGSTPDNQTAPLNFAGRFVFNQPCHRDDTGADYTAQGSGTFVCQMPYGTLTGVFQLSETLVANFQSVSVFIPSSGLQMPSFTVTPDGDEPDYIKDYIESAAEVALSTSVDLLATFTQKFLNDPSVLQRLDQLVNAAIQQVLSGARSGQ